MLHQLCVKGGRSGWLVVVTDQVRTHPLWDVAFSWFERHRDAVRELLEPFDLAPMQMHALRALEPGAPRPMADLAASIHCDPANITSVIARLTERELVTRVSDARDGRVRAVVLTTAGVRMRAELLLALSVPPPGLAQLSVQDQSELHRLLSSTIVLSANSGGAGFRRRSGGRSDESDGP